MADFNTSVSGSFLEMVGDKKKKKKTNRLLVFICFLPDSFCNFFSDFVISVMYVDVSL